MKPKLTPFRRRVLKACKKYGSQEYRSRWVADDLNANETRVSNAIYWLLTHGYKI